MEEKERFEIHIYDDICVDLYDNGVLDKSINNTYKLEELLNQQDKRIKELEEENKELKQQLEDKDKQIEDYERELEVYKQNDYAYAKNMNRISERVKQDRISFAVNRLNKVKNLIKNSWGLSPSCMKLIKDIDNIIKETENKK